MTPLATIRAGLTAARAKGTAWWIARILAVFWFIALCWAWVEYVNAVKERTGW